MKKLLIICGLLLIFGCQTYSKDHINYYKISIIRPDGVVQKEINVSSRFKLKKRKHDNGQLSIVEKSNISRDWESEAIAPVGWFIDYELTGIVVEQE